jgi:hypothetical protein
MTTMTTMTTTTTMTSPSPGSTRIANLAEMVGHYVSVKITYRHADGMDELDQFVGKVTNVDPLVTIERFGYPDGFTLPPDLKSYRRNVPSAFVPATMAESELNPRYETSWDVRAPKSADGTSHGPARIAYRVRAH